MRKVSVNEILVFLVAKRSREFVLYFEILTVAAVQLSECLLAFDGKFKLEKDQPIRSIYSKSCKLIVRFQKLAPQKIFTVFIRFNK